MPATESQFVTAAKDLVAKISSNIDAAEGDTAVAENIYEWSQMLATMADALKPRPYIDVFAPPGFIND